jgi:TolB protein
MARRGAAVGAVVVLAGAAAIGLTSGPADAAFPGKNGRIAFDSNRDGDFEIFRTNPDGSGQRRLTDNDDTDYGAAFSPDGKRIAFFSERDGNGEIYIMRADGTHERNVSKNDAEDNEPFFTPNGKRIVFQSDRVDDAYDIYSMRLDGTHVRPLTGDGGAAPTVGAKGKIVFMRGDEVWAMRADGSHEHAITEDEDDNYPNISPNGRRIIFERVPEPGDDIEIYVMRADGTHARPLTDNDHADFAPVFSPDGKKIAWDGGPLGDVRVMRVDGTHKHRVTLSPSVDEYADWGPKP